jgi:hypothetical protein
MEWAGADMVSFTRLRQYNHVLTPDYCVAYHPLLCVAYAPAILSQITLKLADTYFTRVAGPPFEDPDACPSSGSGTAGGPFIKSTAPRDVAYATSLGNARAVCDLGAGLAIVSNFYPAMKNMVDPTLTSYLDPATACDAPIWDSYTDAPGQPITVHFSALCYCSGALQGV